MLLLKQYCLLPFQQNSLCIWKANEGNCMTIMKPELIRKQRKPTCVVKHYTPSATSAAYVCMSPGPLQVLYVSIPVLLW